MALEIVNQRLSETMLEWQMVGDSRTTALDLAENEMLDTHKSVGAGNLHEREQVLARQTAFRHLESILSFRKFARAGRYRDALRELTRLSFVPPESERRSSAKPSPAVQVSFQLCRKPMWQLPRSPHWPA